MTVSTDHSGSQGMRSKPPATPPSHVGDLLHQRLQHHRSQQSARTDVAEGVAAELANCPLAQHPTSPPPPQADTATDPSFRGRRHHSIGSGG